MGHNDDKNIDPRFESPADGAKAVISYKDSWSAALGSRSVEASYAVIAAAWAVFGSTNSFFESKLALTSVVIALIHIALSLGVVLWVVELLTCQFAKSQKHPKHWAKGWSSSGEKKSHWPYTPAIDNIGRVFQWAKFILPATAAGFLVAAIWCKAAA